MAKSVCINVVCVAFFACCIVQMTTGTECYVCYSWKDSGCEIDYMVNVNLTTCGVPPASPSTNYWRPDSRDREREERDRLLNAPPTTCQKDVIIFTQPSVRSQNDRYNRFNRPWVERKCGFPIQAGYRSGRDLVDDCEESEVTIEGVRGFRRSCICSTDGCNLAVSLTTSQIIQSLTGMFVMFQFAAILA